MEGKKPESFPQQLESTINKNTKHESIVIIPKTDSRIATMVKSRFPP